MERSPRKESKARKPCDFEHVKDDLGAWVVPPSIDPEVMKRELNNVTHLESYVTEGGLLADLERGRSIFRHIRRDRSSDFE